jgi:hypothetical protein
MDDIITSLQTALTTSMGSLYKIIYGEAKKPDETMFPLIEIIPVSTEFNRIGTGILSNCDFTIKVNYKNTLKKFLDQDTNQTIIKHIQDAVKIMEERKTNGHPKSTTILGTLLDNISISGNVSISKDFSIDYTVNEYGGSWIVIASLTFTANQKLSC